MPGEKMIQKQVDPIEDEVSDNYLDMELLRFTTAGSVDDGKSTLIGRLMYDSKSVFEDQLKDVERVSQKSGDGTINLALLTDGLRAEREQGITIDVAYRYFATPRRKFIVADTPGHIQYTRNMVTGASTANLAIILVDARKGIVEQTCRHSYIASLLGIEHIVLAVNKMDLVGFDEAQFNRIVSDYQDFMSNLQVPQITFIPLSALHGDNVVSPSESMPWYKGPTLLYHLETVYIGSDVNHEDARFPVQYVIRPHSADWHDFRGYAGQVASGIFRPGEEIKVLPSGFTSRIKALYMDGHEQGEALYPHSCTMTLEDDLDVSRGDMIVKMDHAPCATREITCMICWFSATRTLRPGDKVLVRHTTREIKALVSEIDYKVDINTLGQVLGGQELNLNEIGSVKLRLANDMFVDDYSRNRTTGSLILVDPFSNDTLAGGMIKIS
jgi:sulfate adenylyltransferase subunit 1